MENLLMHLILPLLFVSHWFLCSPKGCLRWYHPLLCAVAPLVYVGFVLIRRAVDPQAAVRYPYFFLDVDALGVGAFTGWILALLIVFVALGYLFFGIDRRLAQKSSAQKP